MDREALIEQLKELLTIYVEESCGYYGESSVEVVLLIDGEKISSGTINLPEKCNCSCKSYY